MDNVSSYSYTVSYSDTDTMGCVYHGKYLDYFEKGRFLFLEKCACMNDLEGISFVISHLDIQYHKPSFLGYEIRVNTSVYKVSYCRIYFLQQCFYQDTLLVTFTCSVVTVDNSFKVVSMSTNVKNFFDAYIIPI